MALAQGATYAIFESSSGDPHIALGQRQVVAAGPNWTEQARQILAAPASQGLVGYLGYEAGRWCERMPLPRGPRPMPDLLLWEPQAWLRPSSQGDWHIEGTRDGRTLAQRLVTQARHIVEPAALSPRAMPLLPGGTEAREGYLLGVRHLLRLIEEGDLYQANLALPIGPINCPSPLRSYLGLRLANSAEKSAFLSCEFGQILSNSPELYLEAQPGPQGLHVSSVPIKGTALGDPGGYRRLLHDPKECAELTMITDLVRNDLGRVARPGGVKAAPRILRRCGDLWHAEQRVEALLADATVSGTGRSLDIFDAIEASFPPGSVTGAPKVRAMERIAQFETQPRGVYTGAIGYFLPDGSASLSVAIRTATIQHGQAHFHVGAGIVADSNPDAEYLECLAKAHQLAAWLQAQEPS
jgi:para-aminobenzoate synthetase component 1